MTPEQHDQFLEALDTALECAIRRHRALHHASLAELLEMQKEVSMARDALENALKETFAQVDDDQSFSNTVKQLKSAAL